MCVCSLLAFFVIKSYAILLQIHLSCPPHHTIHLTPHPSSHFLTHDHHATAPQTPPDHYDPTQPHITTSLSLPTLGNHTRQALLICFIDDDLFSIDGNFFLFPRSDIFPRRFICDEREAIQLLYCDNDTACY